MHKCQLRERERLPGTPGFGALRGSAPALYEHMLATSGAENLPLEDQVTPWPAAVARGCLKLHFAAPYRSLACWKVPPASLCEP